MKNKHYQLLWMILKNDVNSKYICTMNELELEYYNYEFRYVWLKFADKLDIDKDRAIINKMALFESKIAKAIINKSIEENCYE